MKILIINSKTINKVKYRNHVFEITLFRLCINNGDVEKFVCFVNFQNLFLKSQNNLLKKFLWCWFFLFWLEQNDNELNSIKNCLFENFATILIEPFVHLEGIARAETTNDMKSHRERFFTKEGDFGVQFEKFMQCTFRTPSQKQKTRFTRILKLIEILHMTE